MRQLIICLLTLCLALPAFAERKQTFGTTDVHYSVFNSSFLQPDTAAASGLVRSKTQGVVTVMRATVSDRWGLYVAQSLDGGKLYELPRVLGEGQGSRGRVDVHAVLSFGARVLLLGMLSRGSQREFKFVLVCLQQG